MRLGSVVGIVALAVTATTNIGCSSTSADPATFCTDYIAAAQTGASLAEARGSSVAEFQAKVRATDREVASALAAAPKDIRPDVEKLSQPVRRLREQVDAAETQADIDDAVRAYGKTVAELESSRNAVEAWVGTHCGVQTASTAPQSTIDGTTSTGETTP